MPFEILFHVAAEGFGVHLRTRVGHEAPAVAFELEASAEHGFEAVVGILREVDGTAEVVAGQHIGKT